MTKLEKVIKDLQFALDGTAFTGWKFAQVDKETVIDALELLKEKEPVKPKEVKMYPTGQYACGFCGHISVGSKDYHAKYCPECGKAVKWE